MSKNPRVSIIIPCFNLGSFISDTIDSIYAQTFNDYEIIVVDDGSTDDRTVKDLKKIRDEHPDIKFFFKTNSGLPGARNYGIERASGEYMVCLDADDKLAPTFLEKTVTKLAEDTENKIAFVTTWVKEFGDRDNLWLTSGYDIKQLLITNTIHVASLFRKNVWNEVGGYKKIMSKGYEDWDFWLSIAEKGYRWSNIPEPLFLYRIRGNSMLSSSKAAHLEIYENLYDLHKNLFSKYAKDLVLENALQMNTLRNSINDKDILLGTNNALIAENNKIIEDLRSQVSSLRDELNDLKNSRLIKKAIEARKLAARVIRLSRRIIRLPKRVMRKLIRIIRPIVPPPVRVILRKIYLKSRAKYVKARTNTTVVTNEKITDNHPLLSVIIPFYNQATTVDETIQSLKTQTFKNFEIILVQDGSTDLASVEKVRYIDKNDASIRVIYQDNQGVAAARNNGIVASRGKYIICLDSDDMLEATFIEKSLLVMEPKPDVSLITTYVNMFGVNTKLEVKYPYDPINLYSDNMVITAAAYRREAWDAVGGYKSGIGYEDWELWLSMAELGFWGKLIREPLFKYRTAMQSRYVEDKKAHWDNMQLIKSLHPNYKSKVRKLISRNKYNETVIDYSSAFANLDSKKSYLHRKPKPEILMALPWMTFGGAETLIINFCQEVKDKFNISYVTGLDSANEWEYKFQEITPNIYHLANLFDNKVLWTEFICNYIKTRNVEILHIIHTDILFDILPDIKKRNPNVKVIVTMFNDRVEHFDKSIACEDYIDAYVSDNSKVSASYKRKLQTEKQITVIPNGINSIDKFNPELYDREKERSELGIEKDDLAVYFMGRLSEEKNPDVFLKIAKNVVSSNKSKRVKFFVVGDGLMRDIVEKMVKNIKSNDVEYLGYQADIPRYLSTADIFVLPSSIEGFPLSILEAMAMKVAIIASDVGAVAEVITDKEDGFITPPASIEDMTELVMKLNEDRQLLEKIKGQARLKIDSKYSNIILGKNYRKLYDNIVQ